jgi:hypothetical protein
MKIIAYEWDLCVQTPYTFVMYCFGNVTLIYFHVEIHLGRMVSNRLPLICHDDKLLGENKNVIRITLNHFC